MKLEDMTRDEIRADSLEITTDVVSTAIKEATDKIITMVNEDLAATNNSIKNLDRRMSKRIDKLESLASETNTLLRAHIPNPNAHASTWRILKNALP